jgi:hypothetical protein
MSDPYRDAPPNRFIFFDDTTTGLDLSEIVSMHAPRNVENDDYPCLIRFRVGEEMYYSKERGKEIFEAWKAYRGAP